ncbi:hypothetical protein GCM10009663_01010 [Kitasatospora arboriphila]|uniref:Uncharacterized protein n=1 Tax=Kitasatospora arboriphila TaxID=258052 RepID=A0ABP4DV30_9ACTN
MTLRAAEASAGASAAFAPFAVLAVSAAEAEPAAPSDNAPAAASASAAVPILRAVPIVIPPYGPAPGLPRGPATTLRSTDKHRIGNG